MIHQICITNSFVFEDEVKKRNRYSEAQVQIERDFHITLYANPVVISSSDLHLHSISNLGQELNRIVTNFEGQTSSQIKIKSEKVEERNFARLLIYYIHFNTESDSKLFSYTISQIVCLQILYQTFFYTVSTHTKCGDTSSKL